MKEKRIGAFRSFVVEADDLVVVMGDVTPHAETLRAVGFEPDPKTREWVGRGRCLYGLDPDRFYRMFSGRDTGTPDLKAQATDGKDFFQVDSLPVVERIGGNLRIVEIRALDLETRTFIEEGVQNFWVG